MICLSYLQIVCTLRASRRAIARQHSREGGRGPTPVEKEGKLVVKVAERKEGKAVVGAVEARRTLRQLAALRSMGSMDQPRLGGCTRLHLLTNTKYLSSS